jgi:predicted ribosome quality control (RQC) complex YloA/Tae2 family protein
VSLNWREINRILEELPLDGALIRDIRQPRHYQLVLELYRQGENVSLLFSLANPHCRLHRLTRRLPVVGKPQRFVSFLRAHVRGGRLLAVSQVGRERVVRLEVGGPPDPARSSVLLWARLWGGAANLIATDAQGRILDALYRRPARGEVSGGHYEPPAPSAGGERDFSVRELPGPGDFNERVERHYFALEEQAEREQQRAGALSRLRRREIGLLAGIEALQRRREQYLGSESFRRCGDLILANLYSLAKGARWLTAEDADHPGGTLDIELDPRLSPAENAAAYYRRYRKAREGLAGLEQQLRQQQAALTRTQAEIARTEAEQDIGLLRGTADAAVRESRQRAGAGTTPGLEFRSGAFRILVGRTAQENEQLLRRHTRGNDTWVHARDYAGAYVFIRALPGKSIPLETLLDGAALALWYSKGRQSGQGDVYYTQVKHLRRPRGGKPGLVLPTQEKNLHVRLEAERLQRLQADSCAEAR